MTVLINLTQARRSLTLTTTAAPLYVLQYNADELECSAIDAGVANPDPYLYEWQWTQIWFRIPLRKHLLAFFLLVRRAVTNILDQFYANT